MTILLDIDGVLVTTPSWKKPEVLADGFMKFDDEAAKNLTNIIDQTNADIILTTTHRVKYSINQWNEIFRVRGINPNSISKINDLTDLSDIKGRAAEIQNWVTNQGTGRNFVIIDDDLSTNGLPVSIKDRIVLTKSLIGLDTEATEQVLMLLTTS